MTNELRITTLEELISGGLSIREACERLQVHRSTLWRICRRYQEQGAEGLVHKLRGRRSNRAKKEDFKKSVCELYLKDYKPQGRSVLSFYQDVARTLPDYVSYTTVLGWLREMDATNLEAVR
jgi:transposase